MWKRKFTGPTDSRNQTTVSIPGEEKAISDSANSANMGNNISKKQEEDSWINIGENSSDSLT